MNGEPPIEPPDQGEWCNRCGEPVLKVWRNEKYKKCCACEEDYYEYDED